MLGVSQGAGRSLRFDSDTDPDSDSEYGKNVRLGSAGQTPNDQLSTADKARRTATKRQIGAFLQRFATKTSKDGESTQVDLQEKVLVDLAARYKDRPGGYTRIIKLGRRRGDNAPMTFIELVGSPVSVDAPAKKADEVEAA